MKSGSDNRYYILGLLVLVCTLNYVDRVAIGVFGEAIKNELRLSDGQLGLLAGAAFIVFYAVLGLPMGHLADRFGRKWLMSGCLALWSLMTAAAGVAHGFNQLMLARVLVGVGESGCTPTAHSWLSDVFPASKRAMALSMYATGVPIGILVGTIGGGWVAGRLGWRAGLFAVGLPGVALAALIALSTQEPRRGQFDGGGVAHQPVGFKTTMTTLVANQLFLSVMIGAACSAVGLYSLSIFTVPLLIRAFNLPLFEAATVFGLSYGISGVIGASIGGFVTDWAGARDPRWYAGVPSISVLAGGLLLISALFQQDKRLFIGLFVCGSVLVNIAVGPSFAIVYNRVGAGMRASASALILLLCNLVGLGVGPTAVGFLSDEFAAKAFSGGAAFAFACPGGHAAPDAGEALHLACASASFHGLQGALALAACFYLLSAAMYFISARQIGMESAGTASDAGNSVHEPAANP